jgi:xanthine dehydrogenase accessory factor
MDADEIKVVSAYDGLPACLGINGNSYIIIATRGYAHDREILAYALETDARYIGMIGSRSKKEYIYKSLMEQGYTSKELNRIYCPIGLPIKASTSEEIAVSVAAELVRVRHEPLEKASENASIN